MKKLFIYYSFTGNGDVVAERFKVQGYEIRKVIRKKKMPKSFFWGIMKGGFLATIKHKDKILDFDTNIDSYDEIVIGSPIWAGTLAAPTNTILDKLDLKDKNVSFVLYAGGGEAPKAIQRLEEMYGQVKCVVLKDPKKYPEELTKVKF